MDTEFKRLWDRGAAGTPDDLGDRCDGQERGSQGPGRGRQDGLVTSRKVWWRCPGLNGGPAAYESAALPTELHRHGALFSRGLPGKLDCSGFNGSSGMLREARYPTLFGWVKIAGVRSSSRKLRDLSRGPSTPKSAVAAIPVVHLRSVQHTLLLPMNGAGRRLLNCVAGTRISLLPGISHKLTAHKCSCYAGTGAQTVQSVAG